MKPLDLESEFLELDLDKEFRAARAALKIINPPEHGHDRCFNLILYALSDLRLGAANAARPATVGSKQTKAELTKLISALKRARNALDNLPWQIRAASFPGSPFDKYIQDAELWLKEPSAPRHRL